MSLNEDPTSTPNNPIEFFQGTDDYSKVREYAKWLNLSYITVERLTYKDIYTLETYFQNPWIDEVSLTGTDGF